jgi:hypothetical protein
MTRLSLSLTVTAGLSFLPLSPPRLRQVPSGYESVTIQIRNGGQQ